MCHTIPTVMGLASTLPWLVPGIVVALVLSLVAGRVAGRILRAHPITASFVVFTLGIILAGTLTPLRDGGMTPGIPQPCDFGRLGLALPEDFLVPNDVAINILMFMPFGFAVGTVPLSFRKVAAVIVAVALPFAVESLQQVVVPLGRGCESADVIDNLTGLFIGFVAGTPVSLLVPARRGPRLGGPKGGMA